MINEEKVKLMTRIAAFETHEERGDLLTDGYFKWDYIWFHVIKSVLVGTLTYLILLSVFALYQIETNVENIRLDHVDTYILIAVLLYIVTIAIYGAAAMLCYSHRYRKAHRAVRRYVIQLKRLSALQQAEEQVGGTPPHDEFMGL